MAKNVANLGFWGVRGSTPTVDRANWRYGGNTPCLELVAPAGTRFILDCGTGLRMLGNRRMAREKSRSIEAHIFVTHYHWDHIQGLPFFSPLYTAQNRFHFYSFRSEQLGQNSLQRVLEAQMASPYFPVDMRGVPAQLHFTEVSDGDRIEIEGTRIVARRLNHPQGCLGFRFETSAGVIVYATDNEPGDPQLDRSLRELAAGADIFINDAQYTPEQLSTTRRGWGHSSWLEGVQIAQEVGAKNLVLFHHDPDSTDKVVDQILRAAREKYATTWAAAEGMVMTLDRGKVNTVLRPSREGQRQEAFFPATVTGIADDGRHFEEKTVVSELSLHGAFLQLRHAPQLQSELRVEMEVPGDSNHPSACLCMRGHVVRREPGSKPDLTSVGVVFTEESEMDPAAG